MPRKRTAATPRDVPALADAEPAVKLPSLQDLLESGMGGEAEYDADLDDELRKEEEAPDLLISLNNVDTLQSHPDLAEKFDAVHPPIQKFDAVHPPILLICTGVVSWAAYWWHPVGVTPAEHLPTSTPATSTFKGIGCEIRNPIQRWGIRTRIIENGRKRVEL